MLYHAYEAQSEMLSPLRMVMGAVVSSLPSAFSSFEGSPWRKMAATYEVLSLARLTHSRPPFAIGSVVSGGREVAVTDEAALVRPFATLLHFRKEGCEQQPPVLIVAPMSGHFATLLRDTVRTMLAEHDVYVTDWHNVRDVPEEAGVFGFDTYVEYLMDFLDFMGPGAHVIAVCQPCVAALAATAVMAEDGHRAQPASLTLMAGPIDTRVNPTEVNRLATSRPMEWFEQNLICRVPARHAGSGRDVYPGFIQLMAFMGMNMERHVKTFTELYHLIVAGETGKAQAIKAFYREYFAVQDLPGQFYLETVRLIFQEHALPLGKLEFRGRRVDPAKIRNTALLTVEGERDDICGIGQTVAAQDLCSGIRPYLKIHHMQLGVGHYGVFSGRKWAGSIYPVLRDMIQLTR